jgi:hypothetical protein
VPALIVYFTVYSLLKQYLEGQHKMRMLEFKQNHQKESTPLRFQAYERLSLFCERIALPNLILRMRQEGMTAAQLRLSLLLAIQQEYEHNITQQVYVSDQLWQIIKIARDDAVNTIDIVSEDIDSKADAKELATELFKFLQKRESTGLDKALVAIKKEASLLL